MRLNYILFTCIPYLGISQTGPGGVGENIKQSSLEFSVDSKTCSVTESILFKNDLNAAQRIIINNYISSKYSFFMENNSVYDEDDSLNGNYDFDVAGIGRVNAKNAHYDSQGTGMVRFMNPTNLEDDEFFIWGHDNGQLKFKNINDKPETIAARLERTWRVSEANTQSISVDVGALDICIDATSLGLINTSELVLLVDTDNDGMFNDEAPISGTTMARGHVLQFTGISAIENNLRFTFALTNTSQIAQPVSLVYVKATPSSDSKQLFLKWQTAFESNNAFYTIERSENGLDWSSISEMPGALNSTTLLNYSFVDKEPIIGLSYYRLKLTDVDGRNTYSSLESVNINPVQNSNIVVYPNPANNLITISGNTIEKAEYTIYNSQGQDVTMLTKKIIVNQSEICIDVSRLINGVYTFNTAFTSIKITKQ